MAAKESYHIPYGLDQSYLDMTISLNSKDGTVGKVLPMLVVVSYVGSFLLLAVLMMKTFIGSMSNIPQKVLFVILWSALTLVLTSFDGTRRMNMQRIMALLNYMPPAARHVYTRTSRDATAFYNIAGIKSLEEDGLIAYEDGTYGYWYRVVGSASILLFDEDRDAIISRVDNFYRKWDCDSEITFVTAKEGQKVYRQVLNLSRRYENLKNDDPDLRNIAEEQFHILREYVGKEFKSIHQYMLVKSKNKEALRVATAAIQSEVENSALMIKQCVPLEKDDVEILLASIYRKGDF